MSKITFRADDDLVEDLETLDASKSEAMREALRTYLARNTADTTHDTTDSLDALVAEHIEERVDERMKSAFTPSQPQDINVNIRLDGEAVEANEAREVDSNARKTPADGAQTLSDTPRTCSRCGTEIDADHVYCPNCGEKATHRIFCDCGDELRSDWAFCPSCGRRTPAADVLDGA